ncbi:MAG: hypothetical protein AAF547_07305 [Actinomycetota bacterium]
MHGLLGILEDRLEIGDAVLSGGVDPLSLMIQIGTRSRFSHMAVVTGPGQLTEAYDYGLNPDESDDGVYGLSFEDYAARATTMRQLQILRPEGVDRERVAATAAYLRDHAPGFPTMGMLFLAVCGLSTPVLRRLPAASERRSTIRQVLAAGDGIRRMHCAETATRIYHEAGLPIRFESPRLTHHIRHLEKTGGGTAGDGLMSLPTAGRTADRGSWPTSGGLRHLGDRASFAVHGFRRTWRERTASEDPVDLADLILPGDFMRAWPFEKVARFHRDGDGWVEVAPTWFRLDGRPGERRLAAAA